MSSLCSRCQLVHGPTTEHAENKIVFNTQMQMEHLYAISPQLRFRYYSRRAGRKTVVAEGVDIHNETIFGKYDSTVCV